jgi:AcrR family transcriptional regulator
VVKSAPKLPAPTAAQHSAFDNLPPRQRAILAAAFSVLMDQGYAGASTLEIATRAKVSKRELYAEFGSKQGILEALIATTAAHAGAAQSAGDRDRHASPQPHPVRHHCPASHLRRFWPSTVWPSPNPLLGRFARSSTERA